MAELILFRETADLRASSQTGFVLRHLGRLGLDYEIVPAAAGSEADGATIAALEEQAAGAFMIFALERKGRTLMQPGRDFVVEAGDGVAIIGREGRAVLVRQLFSPAARGAARRSRTQLDVG